MASQLERMTIKGLHGKTNIDVRIEDNTLILVGENGSGKTTFLRILFHVLSGRWLPLVQYRFHSISLTIGGAEYEINHEQISRSFARIDRRFLAGLPVNVRQRVIHLVESGQLERIPFELKRLGSRYSMPVQDMMRQLSIFEDQPTGHNKVFGDQIEKVRQAFDAQILYLPTYRRIERELGSIFEGVDPEDSGPRQHYRLPTHEKESAFIELVEFGMQDVEKAIREVLDALKEFAREHLNTLTLKYLGDVVSREYYRVGMSSIAQTSEETVRGVLDRIDESILTREHKNHLLSVINAARGDSSPDEHSKIICHYFLKLLSFQEGLKERERNMSAFCELCSEYILDKRLVYDGASFSFMVVPTNSEGGNKVELGDLSSGEKQIVSLFSHLYLSGKKKYFVLIDEPELSLSVPWQRRFLVDIHKADFCAGLVAVTHSPFIYENNLKKYAHSLGEFVATLSV